MAEYSIGDEVLSGWKIVRFIDEGSFGRVYEVQKAGHGIAARSALKVVTIPPSKSMVKTALSEGQDEASVRSYFGSITDDFAQEIALVSDLVHPGIVAYQDHDIVEHADGMGWDVLLRMELLKPLTDAMAQGTLPASEVVHLGVEMADVLAFCHKKGVIHRDVKPGNIFTDSAGRYKLGDFGVARTAEHTMGALSRKGTEDYMAPEMYQNALHYDASVDVYALGIVLYQLLNGNRLPFLPPAPAPVGFHDRERARARRIAGEPLPPLPQCDAALYEVVAAACAPDPAKRPSAEELRQLLRGIRVPEGDSGPYGAGQDETAGVDEAGAAEDVGPYDGDGVTLSTKGVWDAFDEELKAAEEERKRKEREEQERLEREEVERKRKEHDERLEREREEVERERKEHEERKRKERERLEREREERKRREREHKDREEQERKKSEEREREDREGKGACLGCAAGIGVVVALTIVVSEALSITLEEAYVNYGVIFFLVAVLAFVGVGELYMRFGGK